MIDASHRRPRSTFGSPGRSVRENAAAIAISQFGSKTLGFVVVLVLTRAYSLEDYGRFALATTIAGFLLPALDLGTDPYLTRIMARDGTGVGRWLGAALLLKTASLMILLPVAVLIASGSGMPPSMVGLVAWAILGAGAAAVMGSFGAVFRARYRMDLEAAVTLAGRVLILIGCVIPALLGLEIVAAGAGMAAGSVVTLGIALIVTSRNNLRPAYRGALSKWRDLVVGGFPFALTAVMVTMYFRIATLMLAHLRGERSVGLYSANVNLAFTVLLLSQAIVTAVFPIVAQSGSLAEPALRPLLRRATTISLALSLPLAIGTAAVAPSLLTLLYGPSYAQGATSLRLLMGAVPVLFLTNLLGHCLAALGRQPVVLLVAIGNAVFNLALNLWLIPRFDYAGASVATWITEFAGLVSFTLILWPYRSAFVDRRSLATVLGANAVLAAGLIAARGLPLPATVGVGAALYMAALLATGVFRISDLAHLPAHSAARGDG